MDIVKIIIIAVIGYLLGSISFSIILGKLHGIDIRTKGSGNAGTTNTLRNLGKKAGAIVFVGDVLKGIVACVIGRYLMGWNIVENPESVGFWIFDGEFGLMLGGLSCVIGHNWPIFFGFKGGKGVATSLAVLIMMDYRIALICLGLFIIIVLISRYVSLGSCLVAAAYPFISLFPYFGHNNWMFLAFSCILATLVIVRHSKNIGRILAGKENKLF